MKKTAVIKEIDYDFPESGEPTIHLKAYDKGHQLTGRQIQRVWQKPAPGILYSEIAEMIAAEHGLVPVVTKTVGRYLRVVQGNVSDARFLKDLAARARDRDGKGVSGYVFYVQDNELHFHPRKLEHRPNLVLEYFIDQQGMLRSFKPSTQSQMVKGAGTETKAVGVDPRRKQSVEHKASNATTPERTVLGKQTYLVDSNNGKGRYRSNESGKIVPSYGHSASRHEEHHHHPVQDKAESYYKTAEMQQVEATAITLGIPIYCPKMKVLVKTRSDHTILLDDKDDSRCIRIFDHAGQEALLDSVNGRIQITDKVGSKLILDGATGNILIQSAGKVLINT